MFYSISGKLVLSADSFVVIDCNGIGFRISVTDFTLSKLHTPGEHVLLYTHFAVREDAVELFGFLTTEELDAFKMLIGVSGVGPKVALSVLSTLTPEMLSSAVMSGDVRSISLAQGVGSKTASRIVLECKDKIGKKITPSATQPSMGGEKGRENLAEAVDALLVLGYRRNEAENAVRRLDTSGKQIEDIIREALKLLS